MTTWTLLNLEMDGEDDRSGLSSEEAARGLLELAGYRPELRSTERGLGLFLADLRAEGAEAAPRPAGLFSDRADQAEAAADLWERVALGALPLRGSWVVVPDERHVLERFKDGYWHVLTTRREQQIANRLVAEGRLEKRRQARRGFAPMYRLATT